VGSSCECCSEPMGSIDAGKLWSGHITGGFSSSAQLHRVSQSRVKRYYYFRDLGSVEQPRKSGNMVTVPSSY
jgi:hypothetical protein